MRRTLTLFLLSFALSMFAITGVHIIARRQPAESVWIAYSTIEGRINIVRLDGMVRYTLTLPHSISSFTWSRGGRGIVYIGSTPSGQYNIFRIDIQDSVINQLTALNNNSSQLDSLELSSDGRWIYYVRRENNPKSSCYRTNLVSFFTEELTSDYSNKAQYVLRCWVAPDGEKLVVAFDIYDTAGRKTPLDLVITAPSSQTRLVDDLWTITGGLFNVSWSPDSQQLLLSGQYVGEPIRVLSIANLDDGSPLFPRRRYLQQGSAIWSPDGEWIAFLGRHQNKIMLYRVRADGSDEKILYETIANGTEPQWSANGRWLAMGVPNTNRSETLDLMIFEADGSAPPKIIADDVVPFGQVAWSPPLDRAWSPNAFLIGGVVCILMACIGQYIANHPRR